jgi:DNA-binding SARP family transcriptional activator
MAVKPMVSTTRKSRSRVKDRGRPAGPALRVRLLGSPQIERDSQEVSLDTRKALAITAYLALSGRQSRDRLAEMFWPDATAEHARGALRRTLSVLRTGGLGAALVADGLSVALRDEDVDVDVRRFRELVAAGHLEDAAAAYTGELMSGFSLRDSLEFDEWQSEQAERLRQELAGVLERLARDERDIQRAIAHARRWLSLDPLHEPAHRALMRLLARSGDRAAALRQYRECARVLDRELGVTPLPETALLAAAIESGAPEPEPAPSHAPTVDETVGDLYTRHGDYARAIASYGAAQTSAPAGERRRLDYKLAGVHHRRGDWERAEDHYRAALRGLDEPGLRARITADWSLAAHRRGDLARASRLAEEALAVAMQAHDDRALAQAHNIVGILRGDRSHLEQSLAIADRVGDDEARVAAMNNLALALGQAGELDRAIALTERAITLADTIADRHRLAALHNNLADLLKAAGRTSASMRELKRAVTLFAEIGEPGAMEPEVWKLVEW